MSPGVLLMNDSEPALTCCVAVAALAPSAASRLAASAAAIPAAEMRVRWCIGVRPPPWRAPLLSTGTSFGSRAAVDKRRIQIAQPIKALGDYQVTVSLHDGVVATVDVQVIATK